MISESELEEINKVLKDQYGQETVSGLAMYRIVWTTDQFEKRRATWIDMSPEGLFIRQVTETREVRKYPDEYKDRYVLETLVIVPEINRNEILTPVSYEPLYYFEDKNLQYLPPKLLAAQFVIDTVLAVKGKSSLARYKDTTERMLNEQSARHKEIYEALYGDESDMADDLHIGQAVNVPSNYETEH